MATMSPGDSKDVKYATTRPATEREGMRKPALAVVLALLFGPIGLFYASWPGGVVMFIVSGILRSRGGAFDAFQAAWPIGAVLSTLGEIRTSGAAPLDNLLKHISLSPADLAVAAIINLVCAFIAYKLCADEKQGMAREKKGLRSLATLKTLWQHHAKFPHDIPPNISQSPFGSLPDGRRVDLFALENDLGISVKISNYGGRIASIRTPDKNGDTGPVCPEFDTFDQLLAAPGYYGGIAGRVAEIAGRTPEGVFSHRLWKPSIENNRIRLDYSSADGEDGREGNVNASVWYQLAGPELRIEFQATADESTPVELTQHILFNLFDLKQSALGHRARMLTDFYLPTGGDRQPTGEVLATDGTAYDLSGGDALSRRSGGFDNYFVLAEGSNDSGEWPVEITSEQSGRRLLMTTSESTVHFSTGAFLKKSPNAYWPDNSYPAGFAFCVAAQSCPDIPEHPELSTPVLSPGSVYKKTVVYRFDVDWAE